MRIRLGRLVLRSYPSYAFWLPPGYKAPVVVYLVQRSDERDGHAYQLGAFTTEREAESCIEKLKTEGWGGLYINTVPVHERLSDWSWENKNAGAP